MQIKGCESSSLAIFLGKVDMTKSNPDFCDLSSQLESRVIVNSWIYQMLEIEETSKKEKANTRQTPKRPELIPVFLAWKMARSIATPPERDASQSQGYSPTPSSVYPIVSLGEERQSGAEFLV